MSIIFVYQKNKKNNITQSRSGKIIYPVIVWDTLVRTILPYNGKSEESYINVVIVRKVCVLSPVPRWFYT